MTYLQWSDEYMDSANLLKEKIRTLREQLPTATIEELKDMNFRISTMYQMYLDCIKTANILKKRKGVAF